MRPSTSSTAFQPSSRARAASTASPQTRSALARSLEHLSISRYTTALARARVPQVLVARRRVAPGNLLPLRRHLVGAEGRRPRRRLRVIIDGVVVVVPRRHAGGGAAQAALEGCLRGGRRHFGTPALRARRGAARAHRPDRGRSCVSVVGPTRLFWLRLARQTTAPAAAKPRTQTAGAASKSCPCAFPGGHSALLARLAVARIPLRQTGRKKSAHEPLRVA